MSFLANKKYLLIGVGLFAVYWFYIRKKAPVAMAVSQAPSATIAATS